MTSTAGLPFFPIPAFNETLYSTFCRCAARSGLPKNIVVKALTGQPNIASLLSALPGYVNHFAHTLPLGHPWKDSTVLLNQHTAFSYFTYFDTVDARLRAQRLVVDAYSSQAAAMALGLTSYRCATAPKNPRFCMQCVTYDRGKEGFAYFHREHQLPGTAVCWEHECTLAIGCAKCGPYPIAGRPLTMAGSCNCLGGFVDGPMFIDRPSDSSSLLWLARESARIVNAGASKLESVGALRSTLRQRASQRGLCRGLSLMQSKIATVIEIKFGREVLEWLGYPAWINGRAAPWIRRSLGRSDRRSPVVPQLLFIGALADCVADLESKAVGLDSRESRAGSVALASGSSGGVPLGWQSQIANVLEAHGHKISTVARVFGVSSWTLASEAKRQSIRVPLTKNARERVGKHLDAICRALKRGDDKLLIASNYSISEWTLLLLELDDPNLAEIWRKQRTANLREQHRNHVITLIRENQMVSRQDIACKYAGIYDFMLAKDRRWFTAQFPTRKAARRTHGCDDSLWLCRDTVAASEVRLLVESLKATDRKPTRMTKTRLLRSLRICSKFYGSPDRFPKTTAILNIVVESKEQHLRRKISWAIKELARRRRRISIGVLRRAAGVNGRTLAKRKAFVIQKIHELGAVAAFRSVFSDNERSSSKRTTATAASIRTAQRPNGNSRFTDSEL